VPIVVSPHDLGLDDLQARFGEEGRRRSPYGLLQEYLNAADETLWGLVSNGLRLRLVRDNPGLTRPAFVEIDLERLFGEELYPDFQAACALESWRNGSEEEGMRALGELRKGVEDALRALGNGFVRHPANGLLRERLQSGELAVDRLFQQLLRLVYRLIFLATTEERGTLHTPDAEPAARDLYRAGYGFSNLRERALRSQRTDRHGDFWQGLTITFGALAKGEPALGLPALGGLFAADRCPNLDGARIENRHLLAAIRELAFFRRGGTFGRVNYRDMDTEELGSVYESLLELVPLVTPGAPWRFGFAEDESDGAGRGHARKLTGSFYTPDTLVQELIKSALEPVIQARLQANPDNPVDALLRLKVLDPAAGSGHFLLAAARRIAAEVARLRSTTGQPTPEEYRHALREVIGRCLFGVDLNPIAVELCKTALWLEAQEPGRPLGFLDAHIQCGNSLIGLPDPAASDDGIPDAAYKPLTGDDKKTCTELRKHNKQQAKHLAVHLRMGGCTLAALEDVPEDNLAQVDAKRTAWEPEVCTPACTRDRWLADLWTAVFFVPKTADTLETVPTSAHLRTAADDPERLPAVLQERVSALVAKHRFFHWRLAFPQVFEAGGFDVVLGNPPWDVSQLSEEEYFGDCLPEIAALSGAQRKRAIAALERDDPEIWQSYTHRKRSVEGANEYFRATDRFRLTAVGKLNLYALFAELFAALLRPAGRTGVIVPTGIATDDSTKAFFAALTDEDRLAAIYSFENEEFIFRDVHHAYRFCLLVMRGTGGGEPARLMFFLRQPRQIGDQDRRFSLTPEDFALINPNTRTCPVFRSRRDAELTKKLYRATPVLIREATDSEPEINPWNISFSQGLFNMTSASHLFRTYADPVEEGGERDGNAFLLRGEHWLPLYEAKMVHHYDHRWATYEPDCRATGFARGRLLSAPPGFRSSCARR
jgi:hypothetical protein